MLTKVTKIKLILMAVFALGFILNGVFITVYNVDRSGSIESVEGDTGKIRYSNGKMVGEISKSDSLKNCEEGSEKLGLKDPAMVLYFDQADSVASAR